MSAHSLPEHEAVWHSLEVNEAVKLLGGNAETGLSSQEVDSRLQKFGTNELEESGGRGSWEILVDQFKNIMLLMLIAVELF